ncbi:hypothetical protein FACS1894113_5350 [Alphaproteobacteria bacterium]|nr:hypothetical protein FACS1894113_5350 [Alphaproteobacteria bacterium]
MNILSKLTEKVTMLETNIVHNKTSYDKFKECLETRASVTAIPCASNIVNMLELIILKPANQFLCYKMEK